MPKVIFTEEEKKLKWNELDYEGLGKLAETIMIQQQLFCENEPEESMKKSIVSASSIMLLLRCAQEANATKVIQEVEGLTDGKVDYGKWKLTLEKID